MGCIYFDMHLRDEDNGYTKKAKVLKNQKK